MKMAGAKFEVDQSSDSKENDSTNQRVKIMGIINVCRISEAGKEGSC